ncbi:MAG TPA: pilin [Patescibacteria group bacterium]|nr:pilin [Patescibacteria group bacterium]
MRLRASIVVGFFLFSFLGVPLICGAADSGANASAPSLLASTNAQTGKCVGGSATEGSPDNAGPFLRGICKECLSYGNCSVNDLLVVGTNIGNFILRIVGAFVLFMYVLGGFFWILARGEKAWIEKGKTYIKNSTIGLVIVFVAYTGIQTLQSLLITGSTQNPEDPASSYVVCGPGLDGKACGPNKVCEGYLCVDECMHTHPDGGWECIDVGSPEVLGTCQKGLCPGPEEIQCCEMSAYDELIQRYQENSQSDTKLNIK